MVSVMKTKFKKYPSITNSYSKKTINTIVEMGLDQNPWQVTLKVHGACFSMTTDGNEVVSGRKSDFLTDNENFFNHKEVVRVYHDSVLGFYDFLKGHFPQMETMILYGELFGGMYNHPDVKRVNHASRVNKGVNYCPHNDFFLFDVCVDGMFINKSFVNIGINDFGFIGAKPLFQGSFRECLDYPNEFPDPLYKGFGLPEIEDNICEGVVIEPENPHFFPNGKRVILKNKNDKFAEKASHRKQKKVQVPHEWSVGGALECSMMMLYITENRLKNVLSHIGEVNDKMFGKVLGLFAKDVWEDYIEEREDRFNKIETDDQKMIKKTLQKKCGDCIRPHFFDIIEGEYL